MPPTPTTATAKVTSTPSLSHQPILSRDASNNRLSLPSPTALLDAATDADRTALAQIQLDLHLNPTLSPHDRAWASDECILRYLRAHNGNTSAALTGLLATLAWRNTVAPHRIPLARVRSEGITGKLVTHGFSRAGMPVLYMVPRNENSNNEDLQLEYTMWTLEVCVQRMPPGVDKLVLVIDFAGMSLSNSVSPSMQRKFVAVLTSHYPERLFRAYLLNAPWFFGTVWKVISPFLDPVTKAKVVFVSGTPNSSSSKTLAKSRSNSASNVADDDAPSPKTSSVGVASPTDSVGTGSPKFSWGGLFGSDRSMSTPVPSPSATKELPTIPHSMTSAPSTSSSADQMVADLDVVDLWQEFGGQCAFQFEPNEYFARVQELIDGADAEMEMEVEALAARERRVNAIVVEDAP